MKKSVAAFSVQYVAFLR